MANPRTGLFLATTPVFDVGDLQDPAQARELIIRLTQKLNDVIIAVNLKDTGYYVLDQFVNGQSYFQNPLLSATTQQQPTYRQVFRKVVNFGALPNTATKSVPHGIPGIDANFTFTRIYATASNTTALTYFPIPNTTVGGNITSIDVDAVNVNIRTNWNATAYNVCYVVLEFLKN